MKYYICEKTPAMGKFNAISKARCDIEKILEEEHYAPIEFEKINKDFSCEILEKYKEHIGNMKERGMNFLKVLKETALFLPGDVVVFQYPTINLLFLIPTLAYLKLRKVKTVAIIHDLDSVRFPCHEKIIKNRSHYEDNYALRLFSKIICHNQKMKRTLRLMGVAEKNIVKLGVFDYLFDDENMDQSRFKKELPVAIAGNLNSDENAKALYLYSAEKNVEIKFNLYGAGLDEEHIKKLDYDYKGAILPDELINELTGSFGLVWDGLKRETCIGMWGDYLKINNPHKLSMYLAAGIPIIIWSGSALSSFVEKYGLGFKVNSLYEIKEKIKSLSDEEYNKMLKNVRKIGIYIRRGYFFRKALRKTEMEDNG